MPTPRFVLILLTISASFVAHPCAGAEAPAIFQVGFSRIDITPSYPVRLNGYGNRREESTGFDARIHARAMAIQSD